MTRQYIWRAKEAYTTQADNQAAMGVIRKITALGVAAMEIHGAPERK